MAEFPALPLWTDAYIADTQHLTNEEHGVYLRLIMFAWRSPDCALPDDDKRLAIMVGMTAKKWTSIKQTIMSFWTLTDGFWRQKRLTAGRDFVERQRKQKRVAGEASAKSKPLKNKEVEPTAVSEPYPTADITARQQSISISIKEDKKEETIVSSKKTNSQKGTRIPDDWQPDIDFAIREGLSREEALREADKFRDYWKAKPGREGVKLDWDATWRNWVRNNRGSGSTGPPRRPSRHEEKHFEAMRIAEDYLNGTRSNEPPDKDVIDLTNRDYQAHATTSAR